MASQGESSAVDDVCTTFGVTEEQAIDIHVLEESLGISAAQAYKVYKENDFDVAAAAAAFEDLRSSDGSEAASETASEAASQGLQRLTAAQGWPLATANARQMCPKCVS